jgi:hypothetical protein
MKSASALYTVEAILFGSPAIAIIAYTAYEIAHLFRLLLEKYQAGDPNVSQQDTNSTIRARASNRRGIRT